jgi:hypothetical protein
MVPVACGTDGQVWSVRTIAPVSLRGIRWMRTTRNEDEIGNKIVTRRC